MDLRNRTALVTGANGGIGRALVDTLARRPLTTVLAAMRDPAKFQPVPGSVAQVRPVTLDLSSRESIDAGLTEIVAEPIDLLVNNAGTVTGGLLEEQDLEEVYAMFQVNLVAIAHVTARLLPGMLARRSGKIVNNASISGYANFPAASTYSASKAGVVALSESLRRELRGTGVSVLHLATPGVDTDMLDRTDAIYGKHMDTSGWDKVEPGEWAAKVLTAIEEDDRVLFPPGKTGLAVTASRFAPTAVMDAVTARMFSRSTRD